MRTLVKRLLRSAAVYPLTALYVAAVWAVWAVVAGFISMSVAAVVLAGVTVAGMMYAMWWELRTVRALLEAHRSDDERGRR